MYRIQTSKKPTPEQMLRMAINLSEKFKTKYISVRFIARAHTTGTEEIEYTIYIEGSQHEYFKTWPELLARYRSLVKEGKA